MRPKIQVSEVVLKVVDRPDGGMRVTSDGVPGLLLSGPDRERIWFLVGPGVRHLLATNRGIEVVRVLGPMTPPEVGGDVTLQVEHLMFEDRAAA